MLMIGTDSHKRTHSVVVLDEVGRRAGEKTCRPPATGTWMWRDGRPSGRRSRSPWKTLGIRATRLEWDACLEAGAHLA